MSLLDVKPEPISPEMIFKMAEGCEVANDHLIFVGATPGELAHIFTLALDQLAALALRDRE